MRTQEKEILDIAEDKLALFGERLKAVGLRFVGPEHDLCCSDEAKYTSELRVKFYRNTDLVDVFEFHIFRDGKSVVTADDVTDWFEKQLKELVLRMAKKRPGHAF